MKIVFTDDTAALRPGGIGSKEAGGVPRGYRSVEYFADKNDKSKDQQHKKGDDFFGFVFIGHD
jgi:hypothetical protein